MNLSNIRAPRKASENKKRVGRGMGSGMGKTSTRGHKGQRSRSGSRMMRGFEGGQMPLHRRLPKRGFTNIFRQEYQIVNLDTIAAIGEKQITPEVLKAAGVIRKANDLVKILGDGELKRLLPGSVGRVLRDRARGIDPRPLELSTERISISVENTFERDLVDRERLHDELRGMAVEVAASLRRSGQTARTVTTKPNQDGSECASALGSSSRSS